MRPGDLDTGEELVTVDDAAARAGIAPRTLHAYAARGRAPAVDGHVGRTPVWLASTIGAWLEERGEPAPDDRVPLLEAADLAGVTYRRVLELVEAGELEVARVDGAATVRRGDVEALRA